VDGVATAGQNALATWGGIMQKRPYSKPALRRLGLLRKLTRFSF
jgi:hypothetical protein